MKKYIINLLPALALAFTLGACSDDEKTDSTVHHIIYMNMQGDEMEEVAVGFKYEDPGCMPTYMGKDYSANMVVTGLDAVDTSKPGLYGITYRCATPDGVKATAQRTVAVCNPDAAVKISGTYITAVGTKCVDANGKEQTFTKSAVSVTQLATGLFSVSDLLGGYNAAMKAANTPTGSSDEIEALLLVADDGSFKPYSVNIAGKEVALDNFSDTSYDAKKGVLTWKVTYQGNTYTIVLNK